MPFDRTIVALAVFILWMLCGTIYSLYKWRDGEVSRSGIYLFLSCAFFLTALRTSVLWYLALPHPHTFQDTTLYFLLLSLLYPDPVIGGALIPGIFPFEWQLPINYASLTIGSFFWSLPVLLFSVRARLLK